MSSFVTFVGRAQSLGAAVVHGSKGRDSSPVGVQGTGPLPVGHG